MSNDNDDPSNKKKSYQKPLIRLIKTEEVAAQAEDPELDDFIFSSLAAYASG